jgi:predicted Zn-dependent protease
MVEPAIATARRLEARDPGNAAGPYYRLDAYLKQGRLVDAQAALERALALDDKNPSVWFAAARLRRLQGRDDDCVEALRKVLVLGGPSLLTLARQDPILGNSAPLRQVWKSYATGGGGTGSPR